MAYNNPTPEIYRGDIFYIMQGSYVGSEQKSGSWFSRWSTA